MKGSGFMRIQAKFGCRRDENHKEIVAYLEELGYVVLDLSPMGKGVPDVIVSEKKANAQMWLAEIKDGDDKDFTPAQYDFQATWKGRAILFFAKKDDVDTFHFMVTTGNLP